MRFHTFAAAAFIGMAAAQFVPDAQATEFNRLDAGKSTVSFVFTQMNVPVEGTFKRLNGTVSFDPLAPRRARADINIDLGSVDAGSDEANDAVVGKPWFNVAAFPSARFVTSAVRPLGNNQFEVAGTISIKGHSMPVQAPAAFHREGPYGVFEGKFTLKRADYSIGEGSWAAFDTVANEVQVKFRLVALGAAGRK
jgi:polyisoprenoid-binding protein YceI